MYSQFEPEPEQRHECPAARSEEALPERTRAEDLRERFLERLCTPLHAGAERETQEALRNEMRAHLIASAAAYEELGLMPAEAMQAAIARFGNAEQIGSGLRREQRLSQLALRQLLLTCMVGGMVSAPLMKLAAQAIVQVGLVQSSGGGEVYGIGFVLGSLMGRVIWKRQLSTLPALRWAAGFYARSITALFAFISLVSWTSPFRSWYDFRFLLASTLLFSLAGAITGALTGWTNRRLHRVQVNSSTTATE